MNFLRSHGSVPHEFFAKQGLDYVFVECERRMWCVGRERYVAGVTLDGGSDWFALARRFVDYVVSEGRLLGEEDLFAGLRDFFRYKLLPVEVRFLVRCGHWTHVSCLLHRQLLTLEKVSTIFQSFVPSACSHRRIVEGW
jgi:hypothetical protein